MVRGCFGGVSNGNGGSSEYKSISGNSNDSIRSIIHRESSE